MKIAQKIGAVLLILGGLTAMIGYGLSSENKKWEAQVHFNEPLATWLPAADFADVEYFSDAKDWKACYAGGFPDRDGTAIHGKADALSNPNDKLMLLLRASGRFHKTPVSPRQQQGIVLLIWSHHIVQPPHYFAYNIETGELGRGQEWCYVPPAFQDWMKSLRIPAQLVPPDADAPVDVVVTPAPKPVHH